MSDVTVNLGYTMNMGNFESLRMDLGVTRSVLADQTDAEAVNALYPEVEALFIEKFKEAVASVREAQSG